MSIVLSDEKTEKMVEEPMEVLNLKTKADVVRYVIKKVYGEYFGETSISLTKEG